MLLFSSGADGGITFIEIRAPSTSSFAAALASSPFTFDSCVVWESGTDGCTGLASARPALAAVSACSCSFVVSDFEFSGFTTAALALIAGGVLMSVLVGLGFAAVLFCLGWTVRALVGGAGTVFNRAALLLIANGSLVSRLSA